MTLKIDSFIFKSVNTSFGKTDPTDEEEAPPEIDYSKNLQTQLSNVPEEEEEEEDEKIEIDLGNSTNDTPNVIEVYGENTKFTLEPVVLETPESPKTSTDAATTRTEPTEEKEDKDENDETSEVPTGSSGSTEIRVEEGYATRQMDEFFRQTIAQIKEELTKKLESNNTDEDEDIGDFSEEDESDYDDDDYDEEDEDDVENQRFTEMDPKTKRANRVLLYQQLLAPNRTKPVKTIKSVSEKIRVYFILIGCIINMMIIEGLCLNYPILLEQVRDKFSINSRLIATLPVTLLLACFLLMSPVVLFLCKAYGSRKVSVAGGIASSISLIVCMLQTDMISFTISYGALTGIAASLVYIPSLLSLTKWFLDERLSATTIVMLGACIGASCYPLISDYLVRKFEFDGAVLILAGVQLNCVLGSVMLSETESPYSLLDER